MCKNILIVFFILLIISCNKKNKADTKFDKLLENIKISNKEIKVNNQNNVLDCEAFIENKFKLSHLIDSFEILSVKDKGDTLLAEIDKIIFNDSIVFILDQYNSKIIKSCSKQTGEIITSFNKHGEGPGEFNEIYDFDVDFDKKEVILFDGSQSKCIIYNFNGKLIAEKRLPFRIGNIRKINDTKYLNYTTLTPNKHLGSLYKNKDLITFDENFNVLSCGLPYSDDEIKNDYFGRDYLSKNNGIVTVFPRFKNSIYEYDPNTNELNNIITFDFDDKAVELDDVVYETEDFFNKRMRDGKIFSNGNHFINKDWIGVTYERRKKSNVLLFYDRRTKKIIGGNKVDNDIDYLPFFGFPIAVNNEKCVTVIDNNVVYSLLNLPKESKEQVYKQKKLNISIEEKLKDYENPVLLFYKLK